MVKTILFVAVNIVKSGRCYNIKSYAPVSSNDVFDLSIENDSLTVGYKKDRNEKGTEEKFITAEFENAAFKRSFTLV